MQRAYTVNKYGLINGGLYSVPANRLEHLSRNPNISYISQDRPLASLLNNTAPAVNANIAWSQGWDGTRSEEHTSELQSRGHLVCRLLLEKKKKKKKKHITIHKQK